jgi:uncharacterized protein
LIPIRFGAANRQLFGLYQPASNSKSRGECIVLCNPFGQEAIRSHRLFKVLADRLCRDGFHVLRFDYFGTGDSAGNDDEVSLWGFVDDLLTADQELAQLSACARRSWVGLRLGATVAALGSAKSRTPPNRLILWEPVVNGINYLGELQHAHTLALEDAYGLRCMADLALGDQFAREVGKEALGFPLTDLFRGELNGVSHDAFAKLTASIVDVFHNTENAADADFLEHLTVRGVETSSTPIAERIVWTADEMMNAATVPGEVLQRIAECAAKNVTGNLASVAS